MQLTIKTKKYIQLYVYCMLCKIVNDKLTDNATFIKFLNILNFFRGRKQFLASDFNHS